MQSEDGPRSHVPTPPEIIVSEEDGRPVDEEVALRPSASRIGTDTSSSAPLIETEETELQTRSNSLSNTAAGSTTYIKHKASQLLDVLSISGSQKSAKPVSPRLSALIKAYSESEIASSIRAEIEAASHAVGNGNGNGVSSDLPDVAGETAVLRTHSRASWGTQFRILSGRAFKNLYRDPALLTAHYVSSIVIACEYELLRSCEFCIDPVDSAMWRSLP